MKNPVEEYLMLKESQDLDPLAAAGFFDSMKGRVGQAGKTLGPMLGMGAALAAGSAGVAGLIGAAQKAYDAVTKKRDFDNMLDVNPDLRTAFEEDPKAFNQMYSALRTMTPEFSSEPLVAGAYLRKMVDAPAEVRGMIPVQALRENRSPSLGPAGEAAIGGFHKGFTAYKPDQSKPNMLKKTIRESEAKEPGNPDSPWVPSSEREEQYFYG